MNVKTTIALVVLLLGGALGWYVWERRQAPEEVSPTARFLRDLKPDAITRIEARRGGQSYTLERSSAKAEWTLPGKWPAREKEVEQLLNTITRLDSRFASFAYNDKKSLFQNDPLVLKLTVGDMQHELTLVDEPGETNRFSRPTYLRLDDKDEVVRLAPGLVAALDRNEDYFRMRRLFPTQRVAKEDSLEKVAEVAANAIEIGKSEPEKTTVALVKKDETWEMTKPVRDRVEPDNLKKLLAALPGLWAENMIDRKGRPLSELGLDPPKLTIRVTRPSGTTLDLWIGDVSKIDVRKEMKPGPPNQFGLPPEPQIELVKEEYRFAKLADNDTIFEIKADKLDEKVPADAAKLRDPRVARFKADDVRRLEIRHGGQTITLAREGEKGKETWKLNGAAAEVSQVNELLDKLANLEARDKNVLDDTPVKFGLDKPAAVVQVDVEETKGTGSEEKVTKRHYAFQLGTSDKEKGKVFVRLAGWPRINSIDDNLLTLTLRPELAYRSRRLIDIPVRDLARIDIQRGDDAFSFEQSKGTWKLVAPVAASVESSKVSTLASDLANLSAVEMVKDNPSAEELDKLYGLAKPPLLARIHLADQKVQTLALGNKRPAAEPKEKDAKEKDAKEDGKEKAKEKEKEKEEYFARLDQGPVFVVRKELRDVLNRDSLAYHAEKPFDLAADAIADIVLRKEDQELKLHRDGKSWKIVQPFEAPAAPKVVSNLAEDLANLKAERYVAHTAKDPAAFGFDKPFLRVTVAADKDAKPRTLLIGGKVKEGSGRYARLEDGQAVFVVGEAEAIGLDRTPLALLAKDVLRLDPDSIQTIRVHSASPFTLEQKPEGWYIADGSSPPRLAERDKVQEFVEQFKELSALKIAAYGPKADWGKHGLDKPAINVTIVSKEGDKTSEHVLSLGSRANAEDQRYARLDKGPALFVLNEFVVRALSQAGSDFLNLQLLKLNPDTIVSITRQMPGGDVELMRKGETWFFKDRPADAATIQDVLRDLRSLRAVRIAEIPAKNLANFGLDKPAVVTIKVEQPDGKIGEHTLRFGKTAGEPGKRDSGGRYALVDKGEAVVVLAPELARRLLAPAVNFGDHNLANLFGADQAILERGSRKATFARVDGAWRMTEPISADAEETPLFDFIRALSRLRADEIVAEKADLKMYGLEKPQIQWKLRFADQDVLTLQVGDAEPGSEKTPRLYARLANKDLVFLLDPGLSARVQQEYRKRTPWANFDPVQVERFLVQGPKQSFNLIKLGKDWSVLGKFEAKVNSKVVTDTLDTLERLQVLKYVADSKADLQLYGLVPPIHTIELEMPSGKRTLHIGRTEGMSQRYYATIPGTDAVFVLAEADAQKILRPLAAYAEESK